MLKSGVFKKQGLVKLRGKWRKYYEIGHILGMPGTVCQAGGLMDICNHIFIIRGRKYICVKCGEEFKLGDFSKNEVEFPECPSGRCPV